MRQVAVATLEYDKAHGSLPPHALFGEDGRPLLSWRVLILPFMGEQRLYEKFRLHEPWDSPHNIALIPEMPMQYGRYDGDRTADPYTTFYRVFVGKGAAFEGTQGLRLAKDFPDGTAHTILIVEAGSAVPWTKPSELPYVRGEPLPELGGQSKPTIRAALADGSVRYFKRGIRESTLHAAITRDGNDRPEGPDWLESPGE